MSFYKRYIPLQIKSRTHHVGPGRVVELLEHIIQMEKILLSFLSPTPKTHTIFDLGPPCFQVNDIKVTRAENIAQGVPFSLYLVSSSRPTIIYVHSYNSNRLEANSIMRLLVGKSYNVVAIQSQRMKLNLQTDEMEMSSEGLISFGFYESEQIRPVLAWTKLKIDGRIYIWGRSMGAVSALLFQNKYKMADGLILDSPFHSLSELLIGQFMNITNLPKFVGSSVLFLGKSYLRKYLRFDIQELDVAQKVEITCPAFLIANPKDPMAGQSGNLIYNKCKNIRKLYYSEAEHSAHRQHHILSDIIEQLDKFEKKPRMQLPLRIQNLASSLSVGSFSEMSLLSQVKEEPLQPVKKLKRKVFMTLNQSKSMQNLSKKT